MIRLGSAVPIINGFTPLRHGAGCPAIFGGRGLGVATVFFVKKHFHAFTVPQQVRFLIMVLRITNNLRMHAVIATL